MTRVVQMGMRRKNSCTKAGWHKHTQQEKQITALQYPYPLLQGRGAAAWWTAGCKRLHTISFIDTCQMAVRKGGPGGGADRTLSQQHYKDVTREHEASRADRLISLTLSSPPPLHGIISANNSSCSRHRQKKTFMTASRPPKRGAQESLQISVISDPCSVRSGVFVSFACRAFLHFFVHGLCLVCVSVVSACYNLLSLCGNFAFFPSFQLLLHLSGPALLLQGISLCLFVIKIKAFSGYAILSLFWFVASFLLIICCHFTFFSCLILCIYFLVISENEFVFWFFGSSHLSAPLWPLSASLLLLYISLKLFSKTTLSLWYCCISLWACIFFPLVGLLTGPLKSKTLQFRHSVLGATDMIIVI